MPAAERPHAVHLGHACYPTLIDQAAALLHGVIAWRPLELWNAGLAWAAALGLFRLAGLSLDMPVADRMRLTDEVASGALDDVREIGSRLGSFLSVR